MKKLILVLLVAYYSQSFSQTNVKTTFEQVKEQCKNLPMDQRVRLAVSKFTVTTNTAPADFGSNLATMLGNALQGVNCYNVILSAKDKQDVKDEVDETESGYSKKSASAKKGKMLGPQVVVRGELTEYSSKNSGVRIGLVKVGSNKAKIGFVLKVIDVETAAIIFTQSINVEGKTGGTTEFGAFGINAVSVDNSDPAVANAIEQGVIKAVEFLASKKDSLAHRFPIASGAVNASTVNETEVTLANANFNTYTAFATLLSGLSSYKTMEKTLKSGTGTFTVSHTGTSDSLLEELNKKLAGKYEVIGFENGKIELKVK